MTLFLSLLAVFVATGALVVAYRGSAAYQSKRFAQLQARIEELESAAAHHQGMLISLRSRVAMRELRARKSEVRDESQEEQRHEGLQLSDPQAEEELKARQRRDLARRLATGNISALRPPNAT
jgi:Ran GTPase-activating protein (RanGAP) involved in mRNA processing and transport